MERGGTTDKLSRRYFVNMLGLGAVAAAVGANVVKAAAAVATEAVAEHVITARDAVAQTVDRITTMRVRWTVETGWARAEAVAFDPTKPDECENFIAVNGTVWKKVERA